MSTIAEFTVPADQFALGQALERAPDMKVEFERVVTHSQEWVMPFMWARGPDLSTFREELSKDPTVESVTVTDTFEDVVLYRIEWTENIKDMINGIFNRSGTLVDASGNQERWELRIRVEDRGLLGELESYFENDPAVDFSLERIYTPSKPRQPEYGLTEVQRKTLTVALETGYFDVPRETTMTELGNEMEVSRNAVSERLRRGIGTLIENTLTVSKGLAGPHESPDHPDK